MSSIVYYYNFELQILEVTYDGVISIEDLMEFGNKIMKDKTLPLNLKVLTDATKAVYNFTEDDLTEIAIAFKKNTSHFKSFRGAFIYEEPLGLAYSILFEKKQEVDNYQHKVFSTKQAALKWLIEE